jgi:hypothetical protein
MINEYNSLRNWIRSEPEFSEQSSPLVLLQTYQEWLKEHFNCNKPATN